MPIQPPTPEQLLALVDTHHEMTGLTYPPRGLQPYYDWLLQSLHLLAESSFGALRVAPDETGPTTITITPGRATIAGTATVFDGDTKDLSTFNNDTVLVWLEETAGVGSVDVASEAAGWPAGPHLKLAEVHLAAGTITAIVDRRFEAVFNV